MQKNSVASHIAGDATQLEFPPELK